MLSTMRTPILLLTSLVVTLIASATPQQIAAQAPAAPCTTPTAACEQWVTLAGGPARSMVYASYPLATPNPAIRRALIMVHGTNRNADRYLSSALAAAFLAGALQDTIVISPRIASAAGNCKDTLAPNEVSWSCTGDSWRSGGTAASQPSLTSFDFVDELLRTLAKKGTFPNLRLIVVAGHSAGGQFVTRYQMANKVHETLGVPVTYVVANPSSYSWPDAIRPLPVDDAVAAKAKDGWETEKPHTAFQFGPFDAAKAPGYNAWPFGLADRKSGYTVGISDEQLKKNLVSRPVTFLLSQVDTLPLGGFDGSPNAMAQGPTRRARGEAFFKYITDTLGAKHKVLIVSECGHNDRCVYTTPEVLPVIFPNP